MKTAADSCRTGGRRLAVGMLCLALTAAGCASSEMEAVQKPQSGFLGKDYALLTPGDVSKGQVGLRYFNPAAQWRQYNKVIIEPVTFWGDDATKVPPSDQQALCTYFNGALEKELSQKFQIVTNPGPGVAKLQVAITDADAATPGLRTVSLVIPQARLLSAVGSLATGKTVFAGSLQGQMKLTDAVTGQVLAESVGRAVGTSAIQNVAAPMEWGDAQNAMDLFSKKMAVNLYALTTGAATPAQLPVE